MSTDIKISPERISRVRTLLGFTQEEFAERLGVSRNYVSMLERGAKIVSETSSIGLLFRTLELESHAKPSFPTFRDEGRPGGEFVRSRPFRTIPIVGWAHAGESVAYEQAPESWQEFVPTECRDEKAFAVKLEGDSMEPHFREGDILVVMPSEERYSGCFVICRFADDGVVFRRFETAGKIIRLIPLNDRYPVTEHQLEEFAWIYPVWGRWSQLWNR